MRRLLLALLASGVALIAIAAVSRAGDWSPFATAIAGFLVGIAAALTVAALWIREPVGDDVAAAAVDGWIDRQAREAETRHESLTWGDREP